MLELDRRGVAVRSLTEPIDTTSAMGRFQLQLLGALAELERGLIQERTRAGLEAARARGRTGGRPPAVTKRTVAAGLAMLELGELTMSEIAAELGVGRSTLNRQPTAARAQQASPREGRAGDGGAPHGPGRIRVRAVRWDGSPASGRG